jgi:hypothetical protein
LRRNLTATNLKELGLFIQKICAEYFNVLLGKARGENKEEGMNKEH